MEPLRRPPQLNEVGAKAFQLPGVVEAYHHRPAYPAAVAPFLAELASGGPVLELGCGTGEIARALAPLVEILDAVDFSAAMLDRARMLPNGDHSRIHWIAGRAEDFPKGRDYALAVAGDSLHWMDWDVLLPRLARELRPAAPLVIATVSAVDMPWKAREVALIPLFSTAREWAPYDLVELLAARRLFALEGERSFRTEGVTQRVEDYVESFHARSFLSREHMGGDRAREFDERIRELVTPYAVDGVLTFDVQATLRWGGPLEG